MKSKKSKTPLVIGLAVLAAAIVGIVAFAAPAIKKAMMSPAEYMQYVEEQEQESGREMITRYVTQMNHAMDMSDSARKGTIRLELSDSLKGMLSSYGSMLGASFPDLSGINDIEIETTTGKKGDATGSKMVLKANGSALLTFNYYMDLAQKKMYMQIPELSEGYLDLASSFEGMDEESGKTLQMANSWLNGELIPSSEDVEKIYARYTDLLIKSLKTAEKKKGEMCEAEGVSQKTDLYTARYEAKELAALVKELAETMKSDEQILSFLQKLGVDKSEYADALDEAIKELDQEDGDGYAVFSDYIAGDDVIGREMRGFEDSEGSKEAFVFQILMPRDGDKFGFLINMEANGQKLLTVTGSGVLKNQIMDGEFSCVMPSLKDTERFTSDELFKLKLSEYDLEKVKKGESSGKIELTYPGIAALSTFKLVMEGSGNTDQSTANIDVLMGEQNLGRIVVESSRESAMNIGEPGSDAKVYDISDSDGLQTYMMEMDTEGVLANIKETTGIDLQSLLGAASW